LTLNSASYNGAKLTLKVRGAAESLALEINGRVVAPPQKIKAKAGGSKLMVTADVSQLALRSGANRIRMKNVNGWSNILIFNL